MSHTRRVASVDRLGTARDPRLLGDESGVVVIEFALTLPIILVFMFAIIQFGQLFNHVNDSNQIAADGARLAAVDNKPGGPSLQSYLAQQGDTQSLRDNVKVCIEFPNGTSKVGDPVKVHVSSTFTLIPLLASFNGGAGLALNGYATMRIERTPTQYAAGCS